MRLTPAVKARLTRLAKATKRTNSFLAAEAIADYVSREMEVIEGIEKALADVKAGRVVPHKTAMARLEATIKAAGRRRR